MTRNASIGLIVLLLLLRVSFAVPVVRGNVAAFWHDRAVVFATVAAVADHPDGRRQIIKLNVDRVTVTSAPIDTVVEILNPVHGGPYFAQVQVGKQYLLCPVRVGDDWVLEIKYYGFLNDQCVVETSSLSSEDKSELEQRILRLRDGHPTRPPND